MLSNRPHKNSLFLRSLAHLPTSPDSYTNLVSVCILEPLATKVTQYSHIHKMSMMLEGGTSSRYITPNNVRKAWLGCAHQVTEDVCHCRENFHYRENEYCLTDNSLYVFHAKIISQELCFKVMKNGEYI